MLVKVKTVANKVAEIEIDGTATIADLKAKIADALDKPVDTQRLVYKGKILSDDSATIDACEIIETNTVIVTNQVKATAAPTATPAPAKVEAQAEEAAAPARAAPAAAAAVEASPAPPPTTAAVDAAATSAPPSVAIDPEILNTLVGLSGYPRETCELALRATQGNGELAGALLMEGIPYEALQQLANNPQLLAQMFGGGDHDHDMDEDDYELESDEEAMMAAMLQAAQGEQVFTLEETHPLAPLERHPQFRQLRAAVAANPALLAQVMELIVSQQPEMAQAINDNQEAFQRLIAGDAPTAPAAPPATTSAAPAAGAPAAAAAPAAPAAAPEGQVTITLTAEENEQVEMLVAMTGVPKNAAIQAYLACGKNAELAANLLFDNGGDF